jgi:hypothetical protein
MKRAWIIWLLVSAAASAYVGLAYLESSVISLGLRLTPGTTVTWSRFTLQGDPISPILEFKSEGCQQRAELGEWRADDKTPGLLKFANPGTNVTLRIRNDRGNAASYAALPLSAYCSDTNIRGLSANLPIAPGVWRWPPPAETPAIRLHAGFNKFAAEVVEVDEPVRGEAVVMAVPGPLCFKTASASTAWLWWAYLLGPLFLVSQPIWGLVLVWRSWNARRRAGAL